MAAGDSARSGGSFAEKWLGGSKNRFALVDGAWHFETESGWGGKPQQDLGEVASVEFPRDPEAIGTDKFLRVVFVDKSTWFLDPEFCDDVAALCAATGIPRKSRS